MLYNIPLRCKYICLYFCIILNINLCLKIYQIFLYYLALMVRVLIIVSLTGSYLCFHLGEAIYLNETIKSFCKKSILLSFNVYLNQRINFKNCQIVIVIIAYPLNSGWLLLYHVSICKTMGNLCSIVKCFSIESFSFSAKSLLYFVLYILHNNMLLSYQIIY